MSAPEPRSINSWSFRDLIVRSEYQVSKAIEAGRGRSVDLLLISRRHRLVVAIENKFGSAAHSEQLKAYRLGIEEQVPKYRRLFIYCVPCDHLPIRSWPLFRARDVMRGVIEAMKAEQTA